MMIKTSEATGIVLDWLVAKCEGYSDYDAAMGRVLAPRKEFGWVDLCNLNYSADWAQGGPIIEREKIRLDCAWNPGPWEGSCKIDGTTAWTEGPTPLVAAMRCFVASRLGETVEVPEELCK